MRLRGLRLKGGDRREQGLDWLNFFVANLQTAFGPFITVYLTGEHWTLGEIGVALSIGTVAAMASQVPAGIVVDAMHNKRLAAGAAIVAIVLSCLVLAAVPARLPVAIAEVLHGFASCMLNPAIAAITVLVAGGTAGALGVRLGRNARWAAIGNGIAALLMGLCGYFISARAVFVFGAALALPGILALRMITAPQPAAAARRGEARTTPHGSMWGLLRDRNLLGFAACAAFFQLADAAMFPIAASELTRSVGSRAELVIGACVTLPQIVAAILAPTIGSLAERIGRRPVLIVGFAALPLRGLLFAATANPFAVVGIQTLSGVSAAVFGVMLPLIAADISAATGRFNLTMGLLGLAIGAGATLSTTVGGYTADLSERLAFLALAGAGVVSVLLIWLLMGETSRMAPEVTEAIEEAADPSHAGIRD